MNDRLLTGVAVLATAYLLSTALVPPVRRLAIRLGVLDHPGERKCHREPVPLMGGLAIFVSLALVVFGSLMLLPLARRWAAGWFFAGSLHALSNYEAISHKLWALFAGAAVVVATGIADDAKGVRFPPLLKFAGQIAAAVALLPAGIYMDLLNCNTPVSMLLSVIWVVGVTNAFNLLDNMDGLSSGVALICSSMFLVLVMLRGEFFIALLLAALIGSTLGFYQFNVRRDRPRIFLGDTGSLLLGFMLGALSLVARYVDVTDTSIFPVVSPVIILGVPVFDTFSVIVIRLREGRPVFVGDQRHLSHRLVRMGMTTRQAVYFIYLMTFAIAANAFFIINSRFLHAILVVMQVGVLVAMVSILMATPGRNGRSQGEGTTQILCDR